MTNDPEWKYWTLTLLRDFPKETLIVFKPDLERMVSFPTRGEKEEYVDERANEIIDLI